MLTESLGGCNFNKEDDYMHHKKAKITLGRTKFGFNLQINVFLLI